MLDYVIFVYHIFIVSGTSMYFSFYLQWDVGSSPSVERWCILLSSSSVVRRCISPSTSSGMLVYFVIFIVCGTSMYFSSIPSVERGYVLSLVVRRYISFYLQWDVGSSPPVERWYILLFSSSVVRRCISLHLQWNVGVFCYLHCQWYVDEFLFNTFSGTWVCVIVSGTAIHHFLPPVGRW